MRSEKIQIVLNTDALDDFLAKCTSFRRHGLFVRVEPPIPDPEQYEHDYYNDQNLS
jgi:hypothetical protein